MRINLRGTANEILHQTVFSTTRIVLPCLFVFQPSIRLQQWIVAQTCWSCHGKWQERSAHGCLLHFISPNSFLFPARLLGVNGLGPNYGLLDSQNRKPGLFSSLSPAMGFALPNNSLLGAIPSGITHWMEWKFLSGLAVPPPPPSPHLILCLCLLLLASPTCCWAVPGKVRSPLASCQESLRVLEIWPAPEAVLDSG